MRKIETGILVVSGVLLFGINFVQANTITAEAKIIRVTVYPDSALVTRSAQVQLIPGMHQVEFDGIIPGIDENTLTVAGRGTAEAKIQGAFIKRNYITESPNERLNILNKEIMALNDQLAREKAHIQTVQAQKEFLASVQLFSGNQMPKDLATKMPTVAELESMLGFIGTQNENLNQSLEAVNLRMREITERKMALERERNELRRPQSLMKRSIVVNVEGIKQGTLNLEVTFLVKGASWYPVYDARADFKNERVVLDNFAMVRQNTGEDWTDIDLTLSTARPSISGQLPDVKPWILRPMPARRKMNRMDGEIPQQAMVDDYRLQTDYSISRDGANFPEDKERDVQHSVSTADFRGTSVAYELPGSVTVKSDGTDQKLPVSSQELVAEFSYSTFPRVSPSAYLGSRVTNADHLQLLGGEVNIFLDGDYVGKSRIGTTGPGEKFDLYLGMDENVRVERKLVQKKVDETLIGSIPSSSRKVSYEYLVSIENYKARPINVILYESTPVPENDKIRVKVANVNPLPNQKDWENRKGVWRWVLKVETKAKREVAYTFLVEHPRDMPIVGLD